MAYRRRNARSSKSTRKYGSRTNYRSRSRRDYSGSRRRKTTARASPQTIKIVIEQPQPQMATLPTALPDQVGRVVATTPRRARF